VRSTHAGASAKHLRGRRFCHENFIVRDPIDRLLRRAELRPQ
jgi:hypothetical protein